jgi:hypothetical protein
MVPANANHAGAGQKRPPARHAAPHIDAGIFRRAFLGVELLAQGRMDSFATHRDATALRRQRLAVCVDKMSDRFTALAVNARAAPTGDDFVGARARNEFVEQHHLQVAAMDGELRHVVAGETAGRLVVDKLAEAIVETIFARGDGDFCQSLFQAEPTEFARGMRQDIDADTDRLQFGRRFEYAAGDAGAMQHQAKRQAANAGANDEHFHRRLTFMLFLPRERFLGAPAGDGGQGQR